MQTCEEVHFLVTWLVLPETDTQTERGNPELSDLSGSDSPSVRLEDDLHAVPDGGTMGLGLSGSLPITIKLAEGFLDSEGNIQLKICFPQKQTKSYAFPNPQTKSAN